MAGDRLAGADVSEERSVFMPTYRISIDEREYHVQIHDDRLLLDGEPVLLDLVSLNGNGLHMLRRDQRHVELYLSAGPDDTYQVQANGHHVMARVNPAHRRPGAGTPAAGDVTAPMPGLVVDVLVHAGDAVEAGQVLAVQEAMKMQMQLRAPFAGRVAEIAVAPGAQVEKGAVVVRVQKTEVIP
jgi:pyruvate carboxylase subunit B